MNEYGLMALAAQKIAELFNMIYLRRIEGDRNVEIVHSEFGHQSSFMIDGVRMIGHCDVYNGFKSGIGDQTELVCARLTRGADFRC